MNTGNKGKLSLKKLQITKFENLKVIKGGVDSDTLVPTHSDLCDSKNCFPDISLQE